MNEIDYLFGGILAFFVVCVVFIFGAMVGNNEGISEEDLLSGTYRVESTTQGNITCNYLVHEGEVVEDECTVSLAK